MADERIVEDIRVGTTYPQPLSRLQVSWGAILAGAVTTLAVSLLLWAFALAIIFSATTPTVASLKGSVAAAWITGIVTTLLGGLAGGAVAGYLPGNPRRLITVAHGFLAWALAFLVAAAVQTSAVGGVVGSLGSAVVSTTNAAVQSAGAAVGGAAGTSVPIDQRLTGVLESIGYSRVESTQMVTSARADLQDVLRGRTGQAQAQRAGDQVRGGLDTLFSWAALYMGIWFATWVLTGALSILGASMIVSRVRKVPEREIGVEREYRQVVEAHGH